MERADAGRLMKLNRNRLMEIRDRAVQLCVGTADVRIKQLSMEIMETADDVIGKTYQVVIGDEARSHADLAEPLNTTENARTGALEIRRELQASIEEASFSATDAELVSRLGDIHRSLEACLASIESDLKRRIDPGEAT